MLSDAVSSKNENQAIGRVSPSKKLALERSGGRPKTSTDSSRGDGWTQDITERAAAVRAQKPAPDVQSRAVHHLLLSGN